MNHEPTVPDPDERLSGQVARTLVHVGDGLEISTDSVEIKRRAARRRRRRHVVSGVAAISVVALGAGSLLWVAGDDTSTVATIDDTVPDDAIVEESVAPAPSVPAPDEGAEPAEVEAAPVEATEPTPTDWQAVGTAIEGASAQLDGNLVAWRDGFLNVGTHFEPQPLPPEFTEAVSELFPQEVRDLFVDGLPATIEEATAMLSEAGLLDEVVDVLAEHPEANEAVYSSERPPPTYTAAFTSDGESWMSIDIDIPIDGYPNVVVAGDALVAWSLEQADYGPTGEVDGTDRFRTLSIARSSDLASWEVTTVEIPVPTTDSPYVTAEVWAQSLAVADEGWVALVSTERMIRHEELLGNVAAFSEGDIQGVGESEQGIDVEFWDEEMQAWSTSSYTWEELGIEPGDRPSHQQNVIAFTGDFDGASAAVELPRGVGQIHQLVSTDRGVIGVGESVHITTDLVNWQPLEGLPDHVWVNSAAPVETGTLLTTDSPDGPSGWVLAADGVLTEVTLPELPGRYGLWSEGQSAAWIVEIHDESAMWEPTTVAIDHDGFTIELTHGPDGQHVVVTDQASGEVVLDRSDDGSAVGQMYENDEETGEVTLVLSDGGGEEIVRVPGDVIDDAHREQRPAPGEEPMMEPPSPDLWLLATADGIDWLVEDLDDYDASGSGPWPHRAAVNNGRVLYETVGGWATATLP